VILINTIVGALFLLGAIYFYRKHREAKIEYVATMDSGYRTLSRMYLVGCVAFSLVTLNNLLLILVSLF